MVKKYKILSLSIALLLLLSGGAWAQPVPNPMEPGAEDQYLIMEVISETSSPEAADVSFVSLPDPRSSSLIGLHWESTGGWWYGYHFRHAAYVTVSVTEMGESLVRLSTSTNWWQPVRSSNTFYNVSSPDSTGWSSSATRAQVGIMLYGSPQQGWRTASMLLSRSFPNMRVISSREISLGVVTTSPSFSVTQRVRLSCVDSSALGTPLKPGMGYADLVSPTASEVRIFLNAQGYWTCENR